jgi:hypothetical protein
MKKEGSKISTGILIGHDEDVDELIHGRTGQCQKIITSRRKGSGGTNCKLYLAYLLTSKLGSNESTELAGKTLLLPKSVWMLR